MKIEVRKPDVRDVVKLVASAADKRGNIPVLSNLLLEANDNVLRLTATNLEIGISALVNCQVIEEGKASANATKLAKLLSTITGEDVEISLEGDTLYVRSSNAKFSLATLPADEFPEIDLPEAYNVKLPSEEVDKAVRKVAYAVSRDEARYILTGVY
ncbi:MAG: DNA polymerase III subunit beta, partial [Desulfurobacteriaceae bacterium]